MTLQTSVFQVIQRNWQRPHGMLVVGVSGGADSLALLHILIALQDKLKIKVHAATLDHGLRGEAGAEDAAYVEAVCRDWGVPWTRGYRDVRMFADEINKGIEEAARIARYEFLYHVCRSLDTYHAAVGHNADDQAETVLMHLIRGAGLRGISGMWISERMPRYDINLYRPLLMTPRADIEAYCAEHGIQPRHDATNDSLEYTRNRIRHELLPLLRAFNPQITTALVQLADSARVEHGFVGSTAGTELIRKNSGGGRGRWVYKAYFKKLHPALQRQFIRMGYWFITHSHDDLTYEHIIHAVEVGLRGDVGAIALLPKGARLRVDYEQIFIESEDEALEYAGMLRADEAAVNIPGVTPFFFGQWELYASLDASANAAARLSIPDGSDVKLRPRQHGDRFAPLGLGGHTQKIAEWMVDHKVPQRKRNYIPLIVVNGEIAAIAWGDRWTISENFAVKPDSERVVYFNMTPRLPDA